MTSPPSPSPLTALHPPYSHPAHSYSTTPSTPSTPLDSLPFPLEFDLDSNLDWLDVDFDPSSCLPPTTAMFSSTSQAPYAHFQPQPAPMHPLPGQQQQQAFGSFGTFGQPLGGQQGAMYSGQKQQGMPFPGGVNGGFVGSQAGDFELFGGGGGGALSFAPPPAPSYYAQQQQQQQGYPLPPSHPSPANSTSSASTSAPNSLSDYPPLPDLVPDAGSPVSQNSPPSPRRFSGSSTSSNGAGMGAFSLARPPFLSAAAAGAMGKGSFRSALGVSPGAGIERPASVPIPDPPRPVRRKTQERRDWPSFYSSGSTSSTSSSSSSGGAYMPFAPNGSAAGQVTDEPASYTTPTQPQPPSFDPTSLNFSLSPSPSYPYYPSHHSHSHHHVLPHTDHPLLPSEQSDLLDRVRRDLLEMSDVDLSSIKGPLRALALSASAGGGDRDKTPTPASVAAQLTPKGTAGASSLPSSAALRSPVAALAQTETPNDALTVSPQEAFLDYPSVDSRLHDPRDPLFVGLGSRSGGGEFGVGVGGSLFAPLPGAGGEIPPQMQMQQQQQQQRAVKRESPAPQVAPMAVERASSPRAAASPAPSSSSHHPHRRGPHPFSVPQNAVTWAAQRSQSGRHWLGGTVDGDADDEDGDFAGGRDADAAGEKDEREEEGVRERARLGEGFGRFRREEADLKREGASEVERERYAPKEEQGDEKPFDAGALGSVGGKRPAQTQVQQQGAVFPPFQQQQQQPQQQAQALFQFAPPPLPSSTSASSAQQQHQQQQTHQSLLAAAFAAQAQRPAPAPGPGPGVPSSLLPALPLSHPLSASESGTSTPRRAAAASALAGLNAFSPPAPAPATAAVPVEASSTTAPQRPQRQRKRSRIARAAYGDDSDEDYAPGGAEDAEGRADADADFVAPPSTANSASTGNGGAHDGNDSDGSYRSSVSSFSAAGAPTSTSHHRRTASSTAPPPKRRRRVPTSSSAVAAGPNAIRCDHSNADGTACGVAFRRPYDLARHKETIHGEGLGGEKLQRVKEWHCEQCGGTFSRKDALLRHGRIRGHVTGA